MKRYKQILTLAGVLMFLPVSFPFAKSASRFSTLKVDLTCYTRKEFPNTRTYSGTKTHEWTTLAVSHDLKFLLKRRALLKVNVKSFPIVNLTWSTDDLMAKCIWRKRKGKRVCVPIVKRVDLFLPSKTCKKFGLRHGTITYKKKKES